MLRLLLDVHIPSDVADALRRRGYDVTTAVAENLHFRVEDPEVWEAAIRMGRVVVTYNALDFARIYADGFLAGQTHPGLILVSQKGIAASDRGTLIRALEALLELEDDLTDQQVNLSDYRDL